MADLSDVSDGLGMLIADTLYPAGAASENASPVCGWAVLTEAGWPTPKSLSAALRAGKTLITIFPRPGERNTTRYPGQWTTGPVHPTTFTLSLIGQTIEVSGGRPVVYVPQNLAVFINGAPYVVQSKRDSTADTLAATLLAAIQTDWPGAQLQATAIIMPSAARIGPLRVGSVADGVKEVRRQERQFQISIWAPSPTARREIAAAIDPVLADTPFVTLNDGTAARLTYHGTIEIDADQLQGAWRRDLIYTVEYATTRAATFTQILVETTTLQDMQGDVLGSSTA